MPIRPYLEGRTFDPERVRVTGLVFERTCATLGLSGTNDLLTRVVARAVIDSAEGGRLDPDILTAKVMQQFGLPESAVNGGASPEPQPLAGDTGPK